MGCAQSKIDNEEAVARSKDRRNFMKDAVIARNAFASGHSGYAFALKNIGAALSDFGHGEAEDHHEHLQQPLDSTPPPPPLPPSSIDTLPPPPPPPNFSPSPIKRAVSMPAMPLKNPKHARELDNVAIAEEDDEEEDDDENDTEEEEEDRKKKNGEKNNKKKDVGGSHGGMASVSGSSPRTPETRPMPSAAWDYFFGPSLSAEEEPRNSNDASAIEENDNDNDNVINNHKQNSSSNNTTKSNNHHHHQNGNVDNFINEEGNVSASASASVSVSVSVSESRVAVEEKEIEHAKTAPPEFSNSKRASGTVNLIQILNQIDDRFLKASQSAKDVSNLLEATKMHYHSNFADNRANIDHSARVLRVITWNRSFRGLTNGESGNNDIDLEVDETLAVVLDKMLAWERKLFEEVKRAELMKLEYQRKMAVLNKLKKRRASFDVLEKTKAAVSHLHTKYVVDMQSMDSTASELYRLRDEELYPKLVALVDGMAKLWESMSLHHESQLKIVSDLKYLDGAHAPKETTQHHHECTLELHVVIEKWHLQFGKLVDHQKQYIQALNSWLKLNLIPIESSLKERVSSPPRAPNPPIQALLQTWHDYLERLPDEIAKSAISSFAAVIKTIILHQEEEMKLKQKCEETKKELSRKSQAYEEWHKKYQKHHPTGSELEGGDDANSTNDSVLERHVAVENLKKRLEEETETLQRHSLQVREKSLGSLRLRLPDLFRAISDYAQASADAYEKLRSLAQSRSFNAGSS